MDMDHYRPSATIYQFPLRSRTSARGGITDQDIERIKNYVDCSSWYHEDAIKEEKSAENNGVKSLF